MKSATERTNVSTSKGVGKELTKREKTTGSADRGNKNHRKIISGNPPGLVLKDLTFQLLTWAQK